MTKKEKKKNRLKEWKQKVLHGQFVNKTGCHNESKKVGVVEERRAEKGD